MRIAHAPSQLERRPRAVAIGTFDKDVNPSGSDNPNNTTTGFGDLTNPVEHE